MFSFENKSHIFFLIERNDMLARLKAPQYYISIVCNSLDSILFVPNSPIALSSSKKKLEFVP